MTSELRPAVEVWREAEAEAIEYNGRLIDSDYAAAAVIEADREAVRAEQAAEIERLRERLEIDPAHSIDGIYARDETIRGLDTEILKLKARDIGWSMQFEEQAEELAKFKALAETLAGALEQYDQGCAAIGGCSDGYCVIQRPKGMHTNGGCRCSDDRNRMRRFASRAAYFREKVVEVLRKYKEATNV